MVPLWFAKTNIEKAPEVKQWFRARMIFYSLYLPNKLFALKGKLDGKAIWGQNICKGSSRLYTRGVSRCLSNDNGAVVECLICLTIWMEQRAKFPASVKSKVWFSPQHVWTNICVTYFFRLDFYIGRYYFYYGYRKW